MSQEVRADVKVFRDADSMRAWSREQRAAGKTIGVAPTMGALHEGHASLMRAAAAQNDVAVATIFVNPTQFAPHEDFDQYPRTFETDAALAVECGIDAIYAPTASSMYAEDYATYVEVERVTDLLCGASRPTFFRGVTTVVSKLFNAVDPDRAYFGQKDAQQAAVIRRMTRDLDFGIEIVVMPIVREPDGIALSSRNQYLSAEERERGLSLSQGLFKAVDLFEAGERDAETLKAAVRGEMTAVKVDYVELVDPDDITPIDTVVERGLLAVAAWVGETRLIDNVILGDEAGEDGR
ncbi:MAG: pantoate--beta-alanine ligase [bacterium]|nr:pantoate--beta-alanine ligase [bacterium]